MSRRPSPPKPRVFISHSHQDRHQAVDLQSVIEENGVETFLDQDRIDAVDDLPGRIREGISWCDAMLLLWSAHAASSPWVRREWEAAYGLRKKIIPYALDRTPFPSVLEKLVYIEAGDQQHGNAHLLKAVLGRRFQPDPTTLFPGFWQATMNAFEVVQATYDLELRANGQVEGEGGMSGGGLASQVAEQMGAGGMLTMRIPVHGSWSYDRRTRILTIETSTGLVLGGQQNDTITIMASGREKGAISGQDLAGRQWTLRRVGESTRSEAIEAKRQALREVFRKALDTVPESPALALILAAHCLGAAEASEYDLGLPTEQARRLVRAKGDAARAAFKDLVRALEQGGWIG